MRILVCLVFLLTPPAFGQSVEAVAAYKQGDFRRAADIAVAEGSADNLAFAARAVLAEGVGSEPAEMEEDRLASAGPLAEQALELDPTHDEARLQQAITLSFRARGLSRRQAYTARLGQRARALGEAVVADSPGNRYAHGFLAVWHVEVIGRGGRVGAMILGASMSQARKHYEIAAGLAPDDASLHWQWARALSSVSPSKYRDEIAAALARAETSVPEDRLAEVLQARAARFRRETDGLSSRQIRRKARALL